MPCTVAQGQSHCASNIISNSRPFHFKWMDPPIPKLQQFQYSTLKIQGESHGWGQSLKSQCESNILLTHIPFVPCQSVIPFLRYDFFKIWTWKSKVKVMEEVNIESHNMGPLRRRLPTRISTYTDPPVKIKLYLMGCQNVCSVPGDWTYAFTGPIRHSWLHNPGGHPQEGLPRPQEGSHLGRGHAQSDGLLFFDSCQNLTGSSC